MRVLVTGAAGFVGGHLLPRLEAAGWEIDASDRELDVVDPAAVEERVTRFQPDAVIHLAAQSSVAISQRAPERTYRTNFLGTRSVLEALQRKAPSARLILVGSGDQYGPAQPGGAPLDESSPLRPDSPYARSKAAADLLAGGYGRRGLDVVRVRAFNHTGPGQTDTFVLPSFARQLAEIEADRRPPLLRVGNLDSVRDFLDVDDVVEAYLRLLDRGVGPGVYNVASGVGRRIGDALELLIELADVSPRVEVSEDFFRPTDALVGDARRLRARAGWKPRVPFRRTLERLLENWRQRISTAP